MRNQRRKLSACLPSQSIVSPPPPPAEKSIRERLETNVWFEEDQYEKLPLHFVSFCILALFLYCALLRMVSVNLTYLNYWSCANINLVVVSQGRVLFEAKIIKNYSGNQVLSAFLSNTVTSSFVLLT